MAIDTDRAAVLAQGHHRKVTHEAGHAVAAVAHGGRVLAFECPCDDHTEADLAAVGRPYVEHSGHPAHRGLIAYAGPWAEIRWYEAYHDDPDWSQWRDEVASCVDWDQRDGDGATLLRVEGQGIADIDRDPAYAGWREALEPLWPAMEAVAAHYIEHGHIDHDTIAALAEERAR